MPGCGPGLKHSSRMYIIAAVAALQPAALDEEQADNESDAGSVVERSTYGYEKRSTYGCEVVLF